MRDSAVQRPPRVKPGSSFFRAGAAVHIMSGFGPVPRRLPMAPVDPPPMERARPAKRQKFILDETGTFRARHVDCLTVELIGGDKCTYVSTQCIQCIQPLQARHHTSMCTPMHTANTGSIAYITVHTNTHSHYRLETMHQCAQSMYTCQVYTHMADLWCLGCLWCLW